MSYPTALLYTDMGHIFHGTALLKRSLCFMQKSGGIFIRGFPACWRWLDEAALSP